MSDEDGERTRDTGWLGVPTEAFTTYVKAPKKKSWFKARGLVAAPAAVLCAGLPCFAKGNWTTAYADCVHAPSSDRTSDAFMLNGD